MKQEVFYRLVKAGAEALWEMRTQILSKPLLGGVWADHGFRLASHVVRGELHELRYLVLSPEMGFIMSVGATKADALAQARGIVESVGVDEILESSRFCAETLRQHQAKWAEMRRAEVAERKQRPKAVPKRRMQVFEKTRGRCYYCSCELDLHGAWHIEHKMPRALLGGSELANLVPACVPCNLKKRDSTDLEFQARLAGEVV